MLHETCPCKLAIWRWAVTANKDFNELIEELWAVENNDASGSESSHTWGGTQFLLPLKSKARDI